MHLYLKIKNWRNSINIVAILTNGVDLLLFVAGKGKAVGI